MGKSISRRNFLKGSIVVGVGSMGAFQLIGCAAEKDSLIPAGANSTGEESTSTPKNVTIYRGYGAAHGDRSFTQVVAVVDEEGKVVAANIDEYQFIGADTAGIIPVPNSDGEFADGYAEGFVLISKIDNDDVYSAMLAEQGGSTQSYRTSIEAIEAYAIGKTADELSDVSVDEVSGATLADTSGYLATVAEIIDESNIAFESSYDEAGADLAVARLNSAIHGAKGFGNVVSIVQDDTLVGSSIDEFQFLAEDTEGVVPVPNSDGAFGENYAAGYVLVSKSASDEAYSALMVAYAGATTGYLFSIEAIESTIAGQKISDISIKGPDDVSGATLVDAASYVDAAIEAAELA